MDIQLTTSFKRRVIVGLFMAAAILLSGLSMRATAATTSCTYDSLNRLVAVDYGTGSSIAYTYDDAGNRLTYAALVQTGAVSVTIDPAGAVSAGAQWRVDGGAWQNSGATLPGVPTGIRTVSFKSVSGWTAPADKPVTVNANSTANTSGTYVPIAQQTGSVSVTIDPVGARGAGAQWRVDGGAWQNSGTTLPGVPTGSRTVSFSSVSGWTTPGSQTLSVVANQTTSAVGTYVAVPPPDDHGGDPATATLIGQNSTTNGSIGTAGDVDCFRINVNLFGILGLETLGTTDTLGYLLDASGNQLAFDDDAGVGANFLISRTVSAGTYYVLVSHFSSGGTGAYQLSVTHFSSPPPIPSGWRVSRNSPRSGTLRWNDVAGEAGYRIEWKPEGTSSWRGFSTTGANVTSRGLSGTKQINARYRIRSFNAFGPSSPSGSIRVR